MIVGHVGFIIRHTISRFKHYTGWRGACQKSFKNPNFDATSEYRKEMNGTEPKTDRQQQTESHRQTLPYFIIPLFNRFKRSKLKRRGSPTEKLVPEVEMDKGAAVFIVNVLVALFCLLPEVVIAQAPFYEGKTLTVILSTDPVGTSSVRLRPLIPFLRKYIPGNPTIIIDYMEGGGGRKAANHIYRTVRPDGLTIGALSGSIVALSILGETGVMYDINKFVYLGATEGISHQVFYTRRS